ncbi:MAG: cysteine synthase A [Clostridiales bacterium]|jgi:cysteine synthase A|nr:cysteine synthase A [Clostridiales bacterium]
MGKIYKNLLELIGNTPHLDLAKFAAKFGARSRIIGKLESYNPAGSVKDRLALALITDAEARGILTPDSVIIEPTSGNTGIGLAAVAAARGYHCVLTMPDTMSIERRRLMEIFGAQVVLTDGKLGMTGAIEKAREIAAKTPNSFIPAQFDNPANPEMHRRTTGPEIWEATGGLVDIFVAGVGTGGTLTGAGQYLKEQNPDIQIVAIEPADSPILSAGQWGLHKIQGIGVNFVPNVLDRNVYDEIMTVSNDDAIETARKLAEIEGLLAGISSGAAAWAALQLALRPENSGKNIVAILPDTGERYISTLMFAHLE